MGGMVAGEGISGEGTAHASLRVTGTLAQLRVKTLSDAGRGRNLRESPAGDRPYQAFKSSLWWLQLSLWPWRGQVTVHTVQDVDDDDLWTHSLEACVEERDGSRR